MTLRKRWLTSLSLWLALPMLVFIVSINLEDGLVFATRGYWLTATTKGSEAIVCAGIVAALGATWEASRLRRTHLLALTSRPRLLVVAESLVPTVVVALVGMAVSYAMMATIAIGAPGGPAWDVIGTNLVALAGIIGWGLFLGFLLPPALALAVCLASTYVWYLAVPVHYLFPLWLRYLSGGFLGDPGVWGEISPRALLCALAMAAGLIVAGLAVVLLRDRRHALIAGALVVPLATLGGSAIARPMGVDPSIPRAGIVCDDPPVDGVTVCLWPELEEDREDLVPQIVRLHQTFTEMGVDLPDTVSAANGEPEDSLWLRLHPRANAQQVVPQAFIGALMPYEGVPEGCPQGRFPEVTLHTMLGWLHAVTESEGHESFRQSLAQKPARYVDVLLDLPPEAQGAWYEANLPALTTCEGDPDTLDPARFAAEVAP